MSRPADPREGRVRLVQLVVDRLGGTPSDAMRSLEWGRERPDVLKNLRNWLRPAGHGPSFVDAIDMLDEASLLQPAAVAAWRGISLEEAEAAVEKALAEQGEMAARRLAELSERAQGKRKIA